MKFETTIILHVIVMLCLKFAVAAATNDKKEDANDIEDSNHGMHNGQLKTLSKNTGSEELLAPPANNMTFVLVVVLPSIVLFLLILALIITTIVCVKKKKRPRQMQPKLSNPTMNENEEVNTVTVEMESEYTTEYH